MEILPRNTLMDNNTKPRSSPIFADHKVQLQISKLQETDQSHNQFSVHTILQNITVDHDSAGTSADANKYSRCMVYAWEHYQMTPTRQCTVLQLFVPSKTCHRVRYLRAYMPIRHFYDVIWLHSVQNCWGDLW